MGRAQRRKHRSNRDDRHARAARGIDQTQDHNWEHYIEALAELSIEGWSAPNLYTSVLHPMADFFFVRGSRRAHAVTLLFRHGLYPEAASLIRNAFEDWVVAAETQ